MAAILKVNSALAATKRRRRCGWSLPLVSDDGNTLHVQNTNLFSSIILSLDCRSFQRPFPRWHDKSFAQLAKPFSRKLPMGIYGSRERAGQVFRWPTNPNSNKYRISPRYYNYKASYYTLSSVISTVDRGSFDTCTRLVWQSKVRGLAISGHQSVLDTVDLKLCRHWLGYRCFHWNVFLTQLHCSKGVTTRTHAIFKSTTLQRDKGSP